MKHPRIQRLTFEIGELALLLATQRHPPVIRRRIENALATKRRELRAFRIRIRAEAE